jgi:serine/threonine protein kinase
VCAWCWRANVARLLHALGSLCYNLRVQSDIWVIEGGAHGKQVKLYGSSVTKTYTSLERFQHALQIYESIQECPHIEHPVSYESIVENRLHSIIFQPRCNPLQRAQPESELVKALIDVVEALIWLHMRSWMHRDLR